ncbi:MAG: response regulator transcription factor [Verrucomicrobiae bacterium]|nr:response regulator transcription factor [Verrucomicrobiae bacterium]
MNLREPQPVAAKALVAEDDPRVASMVEEVLRTAGFLVSHTGDGIATINEILTSKPDVVVLDLVLPKLHGRDICTMVRKSPAVHHIPIVVISGQAGEEDRINLFSLGVDDFLTKPFRTDELLARVQAACYRARARPSFWM